MSDFQFHGVYPMLYAFYDEDGNLSREKMRRQVEGSIAAGVHGLAVGGLASECNKLSTAERRAMFEWVLEDASGRVPVSVTISENTSGGQIEAANAAIAGGAAWVVLQPPPVKTASEEELIRFFGVVGDACAVPVGIQNAPEYIGIGLSNAGLIELNRRHPNVSILKAEGPAVYCGKLAEDAVGAFTLFNGRNGIELIDTLEAGFAGMIPSVETCDRQSEIYNLYRNGDMASAMAAFREILPLTSFLMSSIDHLLCYGKRMTAERLGIADVYDRTPAQAPHPFGLEVMARWSADLGEL